MATALIIFLLSFFLALYSMRDLEMPREIQNLILRKKIRGSILIFKDKIKHYSS